MNARGVFSPNEQLEDVSTRGLPFMLVDYVAAEISGRLSTKGRDERLAALQLVKVRFHRDPLIVFKMRCSQRGAVERLPQVQGARRVLRGPDRGGEDHAEARTWEGRPCEET